MTSCWIQPQTRKIRVPNFNLSHECTEKVPDLSQTGLSLDKKPHFLPNPPSPPTNSKNSSEVSVFRTRLHNGAPHIEEGVFVYADAPRADAQFWSPFAESEFSFRTVQGKREGEETGPRTSPPKPTKWRLLSLQTVSLPSHNPRGARASPASQLRFLSSARHHLLGLGRRLHQRPSPLSRAPPAARRAVNGGRGLLYRPEEEATSAPPANHRGVNRHPPLQLSREQRPSSPKFTEGGLALGFSPRRRGNSRSPGDCWESGSGGVALVL